MGSINVQNAHGATPSAGNEINTAARGEEQLSREGNISHHAAHAKTLNTSYRTRRSLHRKRHEN